MGVGEVEPMDGCWWAKVDVALTEGTVEEAAAALIEANVEAVGVVAGFALLSLEYLLTSLPLLGQIKLTS